MILDMYSQDMLRAGRSCQAALVWAVCHGFSDKEHQFGSRAEFGHSCATFILCNITRLRTKH